jgi:hypothetical protein
MLNWFKKRRDIREAFLQREREGDITFSMISGWGSYSNARWENTRKWLFSVFSISEIVGQR